MVNFGPLVAEISLPVWGTPANFNGVRVLPALLHGSQVVGVSQTMFGRATITLGIGPHSSCIWITPLQLTDQTRWRNHNVERKHDCQRRTWPGTDICDGIVLCVGLQAPFVPFLTEHMYQNLRHLIDAESTKGVDTGSVHYLMLPQPK